VFYHQTVVVSDAAENTKYRDQSRQTNEIKKKFTANSGAEAQTDRKFSLFLRDLAHDFRLAEQRRCCDEICGFFSRLFPHAAEQPLQPR